MRRAPVPTTRIPFADALASARRLVLRQSRDWSELVALEAPNRYAILTEGGALAGMALERPGSFLVRWFLRSRRPFEMDVYDSSGEPRPVLRFRRPWRWLFTRLEVLGADGAPLGAIQQRWSWVRRRFDVEAPDGRVLARIVGPLFRPWTFLVEAAAGSGLELGRIEKKWSGTVSEVFTEADTFLVTLPAAEGPLRELSIGAAVLVDFRYFERDD
jgi:hypothetical protein